MSKYVGKYKNLITKIEWEVNDRPNVQNNIKIKVGELCEVIEYNKTNCMDFFNMKIAPYKIIFKNIKYSTGNNAYSYFTKDELLKYFCIID